jgi:hypothetical protein
LGILETFKVCSAIQRHASCCPFQENCKGIIN